MKDKTLYLNLLAASLLFGAGAAQANESVSLAEGVRLQMRDASARIEADMRADAKARAAHLDVPGVEIGPIELVERKTRPAKRPQQIVPLETAAAELSEALRRDLVIKALEAPGLFGVYRYMTQSALKAVVIVAE